MFCDIHDFEKWYCKITTNCSVIFQGKFSCYVFKVGGCEGPLPIVMPDYGKGRAR